MDASQWLEDSIQMDPRGVRDLRARVSRRMCRRKVELSAAGGQGRRARICLVRAACVGRSRLTSGDRRGASRD